MNEEIMRLFSPELIQCLTASDLSFLHKQYLANPQLATTILQTAYQRLLD